jgi:hypothetical protein
MGMERAMWPFFEVLRTRKEEIQDIEKIRSVLADSEKLLQETSSRLFD